MIYLDGNTFQSDQRVTESSLKWLTEMLRWSAITKKCMCLSADATRYQYLLSQPAGGKVFLRSQIIVSYHRIPFKPFQTIVGPSWQLAVVVKKALQESVDSRRKLSVLLQ